MIDDRVGVCVLLLEKRESNVSVTPPSLLLRRLLLVFLCLDFLFVETFCLILLF